MPISLTETPCDTTVNGGWSTAAGASAAVNTSRYAAPVNASTPPPISTRQEVAGTGGRQCGASRGEHRECRDP